MFGYTISSFVAERNVTSGLIVYGPMILGACVGFVTALTMFMVKFFRSRVIFWHIEILLVAATFHLISSCFYFADDFGKYTINLCLHLHTCVHTYIFLLVKYFLQ